MSPHLQSEQFVLYFSFIQLITKSPNGTSNALLFDTAKNRPSIPVGARLATQESCLGDHSICPIVKTICHAHAPEIVGDRTNIIGDNAIIQRPGIITAKSSFPVVNAPTNGGSIILPIM